MISLKFTSNGSFLDSKNLLTTVLTTFLILAMSLAILFTPRINAMEIQFSTSDALTPAKISNDTVMGGISSSKLSVSHAKNQSSAHFSGDVSLENNGGFASMEYQITTAIPATTLVTLTVLGDGKRYQLRFKTPELSFGEAYVANFDTIKGQVTQHDFTVADFNAQFRGRSVNAPTIAFEKVNKVGLLIADKQAGEFSLMLDKIEFKE